MFLSRRRQTSSSDPSTSSVCQCLFVLRTTLSFRIVCEPAEGERVERRNCVPAATMNVFAPFVLLAFVCGSILLRAKLLIQSARPITRLVTRGRCWDIAARRVIVSLWTASKPFGRVTRTRNYCCDACLSLATPSAKTQRESTRGVILESLFTFVASS